MIDPASKRLLALLVLALLTAWSTGEAAAETAAELIEQAKQYDCGYTAGPDASQSKALEVYHQALAAEPNPQQRLQILFRMAQLHSCAYRAEKGEKPDRPKAIGLYQQIITSYPSEEPLVVQAMTAMADCFTVLGQFDQALHWSRKALAVNTKVWDDEVTALEAEEQGRHDHAPDGTTDDEPPVDPAPLRRTLRQIHRTQRAAVDQIAYAAVQVDPLWAESHLKSLEEQYAGTGIAQRARELLERNADKVADALAPSRHLPMGPDAPTLQSAVPSASATPDSNNTGLPAPAPAALAAARGGAPGPGRADRLAPKQVRYRSPRGPPLARLPRVMVGAAGLVLMVLAARWLVRGSLRKGPKHEQV